MLSKIKAILLIIFLFAIGTKAYYAQNFTNYNWYLGNGSQALIFNKSDSTPSLYNFQATPFGGAGASTASEPITGDLMFYSDGENIYDASHQIMDNGSFPNLQGNPAANQSCVIVPDLSTTDQYFLFVNSASGNIQGDILQNVIDMSANGNATDGPPLGSVTAKNVNNGISSGSEAMIVIPNDDYSTYWLLVQFDNTTYHVYSIDNTGLNILPQSFDLTSQGAGTFTASHFAFNGTDKIAVTPYDTAQNIEILDFDINTGILSFDATVFNSFNTDDQLPAIYDAEW